MSKKKKTKKEKSTKRIGSNKPKNKRKKKQKVIDSIDSSSVSSLIINKEEELFVEPELTGDETPLVFVDSPPSVKDNTDEILDTVNSWYICLKSKINSFYIRLKCLMYKLNF